MFIGQLKVGHASQPVRPPRRKRAKSRAAERASQHDASRHSAAIGAASPRARFFSAMSSGDSLGREGWWDNPRVQVRASSRPRPRRRRVVEAHNQ
eukprot:31040-Pelagococcus_subviridis.AAC.4